MKKLVIIAAVLVASLAAAQTTNAQKIGYVNMQEIISSMPEFAQADTALQKYGNELSQQIQVMQKEFQTNANQYVEDSTTMSDAVKEVKRSELQDQQNRLIRFQQTSRQKIQEKQQELLQPIIDSARKAVDAVAKAKGYTYVINAPGDGSLLIVKPEGDDITAAVKTKLGIK